MIVTARIAAWFRVRRILYFRRVDRDAKCPACGYRRGDIVFSVELRLLVHKCLICRAEWGEKPIMAAAEWLATPEADSSSDSGY